MLTPAAFRKVVKAHYKRHGRHTLPWRHTQNPYHILVSEVMLQQTQVDRVIPKYETFLQRFPTVKALAQASLQEVLQLWVGLGYNRRAKFLRETALAVMERRGVFPNTKPGLETLPGIGPYTAGALMAFAFNAPVVIIETNIRTVFIHHYFNDSTALVSDTAILKLIEQTLPKENFREWYYALMDYGAFLKKEFGSNNKRSQSYTKQSTFAGSDRQIRGAIIRALTTTTGGLTFLKLQHTLSEYEKQRMEEQLGKLITESLVKKVKQKYLIT